MKSKKFLWSFLTVIMLLSMTVGAVLAEEGVSDSGIFRRNISKTPDNETEKANIYMMDFYVPAQKSTGEGVTIDNYLMVTGETAYLPRDYAKPLVSVWIDDLHPVEETKGGISFGHFDAFVGVSLDDGTSWKTTNLSRSSDLSSFNLATGYAYPGDVHNVVHQVAGDNIFVAFASKYCDGGTPLYSFTTDNQENDYSDYLSDLEVTYGKDALYLYDLFGVTGSQKSVDYTLQGHPEIGEIPYSCVWTARGKLLAGDDPSTTEFVEETYVMWAKPERLTSGKRDANLPAVDCAGGAGCILTWQEDPEGLRPGQGLGPGEGWSGAIANAQTDIWYSYISFADFDLVFSDDTDTATAVPMSEYTIEDAMPKPYVPMAMPTRLTDNAKCRGVSTTLQPSDPYCYIDFDAVDAEGKLDIDIEDLPTAPIEGSDFCDSTVDWAPPGGGGLQPICVTDDGRVLNGRVASTRVRLNLKPYDSDGDEVNDSAWVVMAAEETKALGDICTVESEAEDECDPIDIGKDIWYYSFDMFDHVLVDQGGMLNQPALDRTLEEPTFFPVQTDLLNGGEFYLTEIARRFALTTNSVSAAVNSESGLSAMLIYKQGIINQGGPADIMLRRTLIPDGFDPTVDNPYAFENMDCDEWVYTDGLNPNYLKGLCLSPAINISGSTILDCDDDGSDNDTCAASFPMEDDGSNPDGLPMPKVYEWRQCDGTDAIEGCEDDDDLDDQSWDNPYDVAKGHRGFLDGDFVMMMYAWSPNWNSNAVGNDHYNLYERRSFDGGVTWTTTPSSTSDLKYICGFEEDKITPIYCDYTGVGVTALEYYYGESIGDAVPTIWEYAPGAFEQGRNVSLLKGNKVTILDPRYSPSGGLKLYPTIRTDWLSDNLDISFEGYDDDLVRDPSKFFVVYETGDNTSVAEGAAVPLDLYYSRATVFGDVYEWYDYENDAEDGNPVDGVIVLTELVEPRWPWLENKAEMLSGEAGMVANPGGTFMYAVWNQWQEELIEDHELIFNSDIIFRRVLYLPDGTVLEASPEGYDPIITTLVSLQDIYSTDTADVIVLYANARDLDTLGEGDQIVEYEWMVNGVPLPSSYTDLGVDCFKDKQCQAPARVIAGNWDGMQFQLPGWSGNDGNGTFNHGWYEFKVRALDNEGHYSKWVKVQKKITSDALFDLQPYNIFNPLITK
ncbi:MAG: hypothetical protein IH585_10485 [Anaerolineaceae bacterium]|nr:hypothetical protein [Anaerolineaceae bacterium]